MKSKKRIDSLKLLVVAIFILSLAGLGFSQVYAQTNPITGVMDSSQLIVDTPLVTAGEQATPTPTKDAYAIVEAYSQIGRPDLAYSQLQTAIASGQEKPASGGFLNKTWPFWLLECAKAYITPFLIILASVVILYLLGKLIFQVYKNYHEIKFDVGDFYYKETKESDLAVNVKALIEREIFRLENTPNKSRRHIDQPSINTEISLSSTVIVNDISTLYNLLGKVFPPKVARLIGVLEPSMEKGCGITLRIIGPNGEIVDMCTMWQSSYDPKFQKREEKTRNEKKDTLNDYWPMVKPAAFWTWWYIVCNFRSGNKQLFYKNDLLRTFGTCNLLSCIHNYRGGIAADYENTKTERDYINQSLIYDDSNLQALFNLANLETLEISKGNAMLIVDISKKNGEDNSHKSDKKIEGILSLYDPVIERLVRIIKKIEEIDPEKPIEYFSYIFSFYHLGAIFEYLYIFTGLDDTVKWKSDLIAPFADQIKSYSLLDLSIYFYGKARNFITLEEKEDLIGKGMFPCRVISPDCLSLENAKLIDVAYQSRILLKPDNTQGRKYAEEMIRKYEMSPQKRYETYNLACYHSLMIGVMMKKGMQIDCDEINDEKKKAMGYLELLKINLFGSGWPAVDPSFHFLRLVIEKQKEKDREEIEKFIEKEIPIKYPENTGIRTLDKIHGIANVFITMWIANKGIDRIDDFLVTGSTPEGRKFISKSLKFPIELIENWIQQADLMRVPWLDGNLAWLFIKANVKSIKDLRSIDENSLHKKIIEINQTYKLSEHLPNLANLNEWKEFAKKLPVVYEP